jgi:hypothetical protein
MLILRSSLLEVSATRAQTTVMVYQGISTGSIVARWFPVTSRPFPLGTFAVPILPAALYTVSGLPSNLMKVWTCPGLMDTPKSAKVRAIGVSIKPGQVQNASSPL